jgi:hypothetical protein
MILRACRGNRFLIESKGDSSNPARQAVSTSNCIVDHESGAEAVGVLRQRETNLDADSILLMAEPCANT